MGVDLKLLPAERCAVPKDSYRSVTILDLMRSHDLWDQIVQLPCEPLAAPLYTPLGRNEKDYRFEKGVPERELDEDDWAWDLRRVTDGDFDSPLCTVAASDLVTLREHEYVRTSHQNRAAWAYLAELPPETKVVLYWC